MREHTTTDSAQEKRFSPSSDSSYDHSKEHRTIFESLLIGTFILIAVVSVLLFISYSFFHNVYVVNRIVLCALALIYLAVTYVVWMTKRRHLASRLLILFYFVIATVVLAGWGLNTSFGLLIFAVSIILSGILLGARHVLVAAVVTISLIMGIQSYITLNHSPLFVTNPHASHFGDAIAYSVLLSILALISWLFGRQTERLFAKNKQAERELIKEKELLEVRVEERTRQLQKAQIDEMEQLYQFAEMGQLSAALVHDLANQLSVLNFDIADLKKHQHTQAVRHAEESVAYLEQVVNRVRQQLQGKSGVQQFDIIACLKESITIIEAKLIDTKAIISLESSEKLPKLYGDPIRLSHVVNILMQNAIEAYNSATPTEKKTVDLIVTQDRSTVSIHVRDAGVGISPARQKTLFAPFNTTKKEGLGIGLYIAKKIVETHFKGTLELNNAAATGTTEFVITLPKSSKK